MLSELSVAERLDLLEATWTSLENTPELVPVPDWHKAVLDRRLDAATSGAAETRDWESVKRAILSNLRS